MESTPIIEATDGENISDLLDNAEELVGVVEQDIMIAGVKSINDKSGELSLKTINNTDLLTSGNLDLQETLTAGDGIILSDSNIISVDTDTIATKTEVEGKQDQLTSDQLEAVNSGIDSTLVAQITTNKNNITTINSKIPAQASSTNKLADRDFVNSSIATETANYISNNGEPFTSVEQLEAYTGTVTDNDYAFVTGTDSAGNTYYDRYKASVTGGVVTWAKEYRLNNSSFTSDQWKSINSGITDTAVTQIGTNANDITDLQTNKQNKLTAGDNITITGNTISATDTTYSAGTGLTLTGTTFNVTEPAPTGFWDGSATDTETGTNITINNALSAPAKDVKLKGDISQTTYTGTNLFDITNIVSLTNTTYTSDGWATATLDNTSGTSTKFANFSPSQLPATLLPTGTNCTVVAEIQSASGNGTLYLTSDRADSQFSEFSVDLANVSAGSVVFGSVKSKSDYTGCTRSTRNYMSVQAGYSCTVTYRMSLFIGTVTPETFSYQPWTGGLPSPNPDFPQNVNVVTGTQTVTVNSTAYSVRLGSMELCKIGNYQDYIYKQNGNWYKHAELGKAILTGDEGENWGKANISGRDVYYSDKITDYLRSDNVPISNNGIGSTNVSGANYVPNNSLCFGTQDAQNRFYIRYDGKWATKSDLQTWLSTHNTTVYYALATPTDTQITDTDLIADLEALANAKLLTGQNTLYASGVSPNLDAILTIEALQNNWNGLSQYLTSESSSLETRLTTVEAQLVGVDSALNTINNGGGA